MTVQRGPAERPETSETSFTTRGRPNGALGAVVAGIAVVAIALIVRALPSTGAGAGPTSSLVAVGSSEPTTTPASSVPTAAPTLATALPSASAGIPGEVPGPDATIPPGGALLPGVTVEGLASAAASLDMDCASTFGGPPGWSGGYQLGCEGTDESGQASLHLSALYWTSDGVVSLRLLVLSTGSDDIDPSLASKLLVPIATQVGGDAAGKWVSSRIGDEACNGGCEFTDNDILLTLSVAESGYHLLHFDQASTFEGPRARKRPE